MAAARESLPAHAANVRLLTCVSPQVNRQIAAVFEPRPTHLAEVRLLASVDRSHVARQEVKLSEGRAAYFANEGLLTCVHSEVHLEFRIVLEVFPTRVTFEGLFTCGGVTAGL